MIINFCARSCSFKRRRQPKDLRLDLFISFKRRNERFQAGNFPSLRLTLERAELAEKENNPFKSLKASGEGAEKDRYEDSEDNYKQIYKISRLKIGNRAEKIPLNPHFSKKLPDIREITFPHPQTIRIFEAKK